MSPSIHRVTSEVAKKAPSTRERTLPVQSAATLSFEEGGERLLMKVWVHQRTSRASGNEHEVVHPSDLHPGPGVFS